MEPIAVPVRACACPGTPHSEGDVVYMAAKLPLEGGIQAKLDRVEAGTDGNVLYRLWAMTMVRYGAVAWNFVDDKGQPVPFDVGVLLADSELGLPLADKADELYLDGLVRPLALARSRTSSPGPTNGSSSTKRTRSRRASSSPATSAGTPSPVPVP